MPANPGSERCHHQADPDPGLDQRDIEPHDIDHDAFEHDSFEHDGVDRPDGLSGRHAAVQLPDAPAVRWPSWLRVRAGLCGSLRS